MKSESKLALAIISGLTNPTVIGILLVIALYVLGR